MAGPANQNGTSVQATTSCRVRGCPSVLQTNSVSVLHKTMPPCAANEVEFEVIIQKTTRLRTALLASVVMLPNANVVFAQTEEQLVDDDWIIIADQMRRVLHVTANRREQPISEIGSSVSVLTGEELELGQYTFAVDALQSLSGVSINQNGTFGGSASVRIRGASSDQTVILIDGVQVNDPSSPGNGYNFANLDPNGIERIEVLKGPQSVLYGSDAIGGVVNVITKVGGAGFNGSAFAEYGSFNTLRGGGSLYGGEDTLAFGLTLAGTTTDGISKAEARDGNTEKDGFDNWTALGRVSSQASDNLKLEALGRYADSRNEFDSFGPTDGDNVGHAEEYTVAGRASLGLFDNAFQNTVSVEYSKTDRQNLTDGVESFAAIGERFNLDYLGVYDVSDDWTITSGLQHEEVQAKTVDPEKFSIDSVFGELAWNGIDGLGLSAGVRYDDHDTFGDTTNARFTAYYEFEETGTRLIANWGEGFKAPSVFQLTFICGFCGLTEPSRDLRPERSKAWEVGVEQSTPDDRLKLGATFFRQQIDDLIIFTFTGGYANVDETLQKGIELSASAQLADNLSLSGNYTYTSARDRLADAQLIRVPKHAAFARLAWDATEQLHAALDVTYNGSEVDRGDAPVESWIRVDAKLAYDLSDAVQLYGRVENAFDEQYQQILGFGTPGVSVYGGIRGNF